jgi:hypothetical protein
MRIIVEGGANLDGPTWERYDRSDRATIARRLQDGVYQVVGKDIVEPVECFDDETTAIARMVAEASKTRYPHKVTLNMDVSDGD